MMPMRRLPYLGTWSIHDVWQGLAVAAGAVFAFLFPDGDSAIWFYCGLGAIAMDFATGVISAFSDGMPITSRKIQRTCSKFLSFALMLVCIGILTHTTQALRGVQMSFIAVFCGMVVGRELWSAIENLHRMGMPIPAAIRRALEGLSEKRDDSGDPPSG